MSRHGARKNKRWFQKESTFVKRLSNREARRAGKKLGEDAPPKKSSQGWRTH